MRDVFTTTTLAFILTPILFVGIHHGYAQVMGSTNYRIQSDSINFGGGLATSSNYVLEATAGEVGSGESDSLSYGLNAGYQQMQEVFIALSVVSPVVLSPAIPGISGGEANGSTTVTVTTDSAAGYQLLIAATESPAMRKDTDTIADYAPGSVPSFAFGIGLADAHFGYSPAGNNIVNRFRDNGSDCGSGSFDTALACWDGLSTTLVPVAQGSAANHPNGATTTIYFRVGVGGAVVQPPGFYTATTTLTALPL